MAPEIEWDVDTSTHSQTIVRTPPPRSSSPRNRIVVLLVAVFGITLGVIYRSIPEPPQPPTPTIRPTPTLVVSLDRVIDQEAHALERGDPQAFMRLQDPVDPEWRAQQINSFKKWGEPPVYSDLYAIVISGTLDSDRVWVDISQARDGQFFRETRFYRLVNGQWFRTSPDVSLWGDGRLLRTNHFDLLYQAGEDYHAQIVAQQLEKFYTRVCQDLNCTLGKPIEPLVFLACRTSDCSDAAGFDPNPAPQFTVILSPIAQKPAVLGYTQQHITITMQSPRLSGLYFQSLYSSAPGNDGPIERLAINPLLVPHFIAKVASGGPERWSKSEKGILFVDIIEERESNLILPQGLAGYSELLASLRNVKVKDWLSLDALWDSIPPSTMLQSQLEQAFGESWSVIQFIETKYGAEGIVHFLNAIGPAQSMSDALQNGLNVSYAQFDQGWRVWLKTQLSK